MASTTGIEYYLNLVNPGAPTGNGGGGNGGGGGGDNKGTNKIANELQKGNKGQKKGLGATLGIKFGIASLLKQSQVLTGFIGTIFQLMGALVDVILAPFLPILIPGIRLIASMIPHVSKYAQAIYNWIDTNIIPFFKNLPIPDWIKDNVAAALSAVLVGVVMAKFLGVWGIFSALIKTFLGKPLWAMIKASTAVIGRIMSFLGSGPLLTALKDGVKTAGKFLWEIAGRRIATELGVAGRAIVTSLDNVFGPMIRTISEAAPWLVEQLVRMLWTDGIHGKFIAPVMSQLGKLWPFIDAPLRTAYATVVQPLVAGIADMFTWAMNGLKELPIFKKLAEMIPNATKWFSKELGPKLLGKVARGALGLGQKFGKKAVMGIDDMGMPIKIPGGLSTIKKLAMGVKAIPVLGAVAELGFGGWETYQDYKKYGAKAAMGRAGLTLANATAALFDPSGVASAGASIATNIAMTKAYEHYLDPKDEYKRTNPDLFIHVTDENSGLEGYVKNVAKDTDKDIQLAVGNLADRTSLDGEQR